jgi:hypothetical protein
MISKSANEILSEYATNKFICFYYSREIYFDNEIEFECIPDYHFIDTNNKKNALAELYETLEKEKQSLCRYQVNPNYDNTTNMCLNGHIMHMSKKDNIFMIHFNYEHGSEMLMTIMDCSNKNIFTDGVINKIKTIIG